MKRLIIEELRKWKLKKRRKPLILRGARQVGKTWILKEFGKEFKDGFIHINFDKEPQFARFFAKTKNIDRILDNLCAATGHKITKEKLLIFDEIQACPDALNSLKYFCEDAPEYYVAAAGSLLGLTLSKGFPVGKVDFLSMGPMTFEEFLLACNEDSLFNYLRNIKEIEPIPDYFHERLIEKLKMYFVIGGMPESVLTWIEDKDMSEVDDVLLSILDAYESDFGKYAPTFEVNKIKYIWESLPSQLARENKKFLYSVVKPGARAREYETALMWLNDANLTRKVIRITKPGLPLSAYEDLNAFKIYLVDVGLLRRYSKLATTSFKEENRLFTEFKGALTENYVLQSLERLFDVKPYYWSDTKHEVDFIIQKENDIFPIEVKAGINVQSSSIRKYILSYEKETKFAIRLSLKNLSFDGKVLNIPLYLADELDRIINLIIKD